MKAYRRISDGRVAETYSSYNQTTGARGVYYVIPGEPANITKQEVDNKEKWELIEIEPPNMFVEMNKLTSELQKHRTDNF